MVFRVVSSAKNVLGRSSNEHGPGGFAGQRKAGPVSCATRMEDLGG
jgi:hypothetical protein